jgi:hypothetical protein
MYDVDRINRLLPSVTGRQSDDSRSEVSAKNSRLLTFEFLIIRQEGLEPPAVEHEVYTFSGVLGNVVSRAISV